jgi:hypothetical protein
MAVARSLSSQNPELPVNCLSSLILIWRFSTSKKPPQSAQPGPHID